MPSCKGLSEVWSSVGWLRVYRGFFGDVRTNSEENCVERTREMVVFIVSQVVGAALQGNFGGLEQWGSAQSAKGLSQRYEEDIC